MWGEHWNVEIQLGEFDNMNFGMLELGEMSFRILKMSWVRWAWNVKIQFDNAKFGILELGDMSFGMLKTS